MGSPGSGQIDKIVVSDPDDLEHRPNCGLPVLWQTGGALKIIAAIEFPPVIVKILSHPGLPTRAPPRSPGSSSRSIPDNLRTRKPLANASRRRRSL
jgi:hypothetical protein